MTHGNPSVSRSSDRLPTKAIIRTQLERVLASPEFAASQRKRRFLSYIVDQTLRGQSEHLCAYDIALHAFDRDLRFDPQTDPLVRIAARRVRDSLDHYYLTAGQRDPIKIVIPKGRYIPQFQQVPASVVAETKTTGTAAAVMVARDSNRRSTTVYVVAALAIMLISVFAAAGSGRIAFPRHPATSPTAAAAGQPHVAIEPLVNLAGDPALDEVAHTLTGRIVTQSAKSTVQLTSANASPDLLLKGTVDRIGPDVRVQSLLLAPANGKVVWSRAYLIASAADAAILEREIPADITQELARISTAPR